MTGTTLGADTESAPINGSFSLIKSLKLSSAGKNCTRRTISTKVFSSKICLIFQTIFREAWQKTSFGILTLTPPQRLMAMRLTPECEQTALLSHQDEIVKTIIPVNRYSFFEGLSDKLLPPIQLEFEIEPQNDQEMIFQNDGTARRIVVRKFELWVPQLHFTGKGQTLANENFLKPTF